MDERLTNLYLRAMTKKTLVLSLVLLVSFYGQAQSDSTLDPVSVTATLGPAKISRTGRHLVIIPGNLLQKLPIHSIDEMLRYVPGVEVQSRGPMGTQSDIVMRGGTFQQVLVLLDGLRLNDPITGHFNSYIPVAMEEIERIEVLKGPAAALYGSDAVGGVIHVITKTFHRSDSLLKTVASARYTHGDNKLRSAQGGVYAASRKWAVSGGVLANKAEGLMQRGTTSYFNNQTASISAGYRPSDKFKLALRSSYDDRSFSAQNYYTTFLSDTAKEQVRTAWQQAGVQFNTERSVWKADLGFKVTDDEYAFNSVAIPNKNKSSLWQALLQHQIGLSKGNRMHSGLQLVRRGIHSNDRGDHDDLNLIAFSQLLFNLTKDFTVLPALRFDWHEQRGLETVPQLSLAYNLNRWGLRASAGKTIRDADFTERYNNYNKPVVASGRIGNPDLQAETAFAYEGGIDFTPTPKWKISAGYFQRFHKGLIDYAPTAYADMPRKTNLVPTGTYALAKNLSDVNIYGTEIDIRFELPLRTTSGRLSGNAGAVWAKAHSDEPASSFYLSSFAHFLTNFNLVYSNSWFNAGFSGVYKERSTSNASSIGARLSADYLVINGKVEVDLFKRKAAIYAQVDNIFDVSYSDFLGAEMPGRWLMGGVKLRL